jgi:hypothetical protein
VSSSLRLLRWFSPAYRYALKSEAEGRYVEAARAYALCGQHLKVAEMHILEAECRGAPASALRELHVAAHFVEATDDDAESRALYLRLGQSYLRILKKSPITPAERDLCAEAAQLLLRGGDPLAAAQAYELAGDLTGAARVYEQAGEIERLEQLHEMLATQRQSQEEEHALWQAVELHLDLGERDAALAALERLGRVGADRARAHEQRAALLLRRPTPYLVALRLTTAGTGQDLLVVGRLPLLLGRGEPGGAESGDVTTRSLRFSDPGLSRQHAQIETLPGPDGPRFALRDLGSKNGTTLGGLPIASALALPPESEVGLGQHVSLRLRTGHDPLRLDFEVSRGLSRGLRGVICEGPLPLPPPPPGSTRMGGSPLGLRFTSEGQPLLTATADLRLNGKRVAPQVQLLRGDRLVGPDDLQLEVR